MWWTRFHMWTKFRVNWSKTATCIEWYTNKQTNGQTNRQTNILANFFEILASNNMTPTETELELVSCCIWLWYLGRVDTALDKKISELYIMWLKTSTTYHFGLKGGGIRVTLNMPLIFRDWNNMFIVRSIYNIHITARTCVVLMRRIILCWHPKESIYSMHVDICMGVSSQLGVNVQNAWLNNSCVSWKMNSGPCILQ